MYYFYCAFSVNSWSLTAMFTTNCPSMINISVKILKILNICFTEESNAGLE